MREYYLHRSCIFDCPAYVYDCLLFSRCILLAGGKDVLVKPYMDWSNQPEIVRFWADDETLKQIEAALSQIKPFKDHPLASPLIYEVHWRQREGVNVDAVAHQSRIMGFASGSQI